MGKIDYEEKYKALKAEMDLIKRTAPEDNLNYLINQINCGNLKTDGNEVVINILQTAINGIKNITKKLNKDRSTHLSTKNKKKNEQ